MSKPIIVGVAPQRDNDSSLRLATGMSRITGAPIVAIASLPHETQGTRIGADLRADAAPTLAALAGGLDAELEVITGASPARALNNAAIARDAGMIVVGPTQLAWVGGLRPGTTAEQLLPSSACAIAIAPKRLNDEWTPRRVGVGFIDLEEGYEALRAAVALAGAAAASLHVVTALEPLDLSRSTPDRIGVGLDAAEVAARRALRVAVEQLAPCVPATAKVVVGHAPDSLIALSTEVDLLVCGSRAHGPSDLLGSVTRRLTRFANCPVIIVPRGAERSIQRLLDHHEPISTVTESAR